MKRNLNIMTKKEAFIELIDYVFYKEDFYLKEGWEEIFPFLKSSQKEYANG